MSFTDLQDFNEEFRYTSPSGLLVQLEKLGGGTVGEAYEGTWRYIVSHANGAELRRGQDFTTGVPCTYGEVASDIAEYFANKLEDWQQPHTTVLFMPMSPGAGGQIHVTLGRLYSGQFEPTDTLGCLPQNRTPDEPILTLSAELRLLADYLDPKETP